jgi:hypothetical protein
MLLGVFFVATMPLIFHHIRSATSSPKEGNANGAFALRLRVGEVFLRGKVGRVSALRSRVLSASAQCGRCVIRLRSRHSPSLSHFFQNLAFAICLGLLSQAIAFLRKLVILRGRFPILR